MTGELVTRAAANPEISEVSTPLFVLAGLFALQQVLGLAQQVVGFTATRRINGNARSAAMETPMRPAGIACWRNSRCRT